MRVSGWTALMWSAFNGCLEIVRLLIPYEAMMHDDYDRTALMESAAGGRLEVVRLLIPYEAKMRDKDNSTALMKAAWNGHHEIAKLLIPHEARVQDKYGWTALMKAAWNGRLEVAELLVSQEAGMKNNNGGTATMIAAQAYHPKGLRPLLENEIERNASGITPVAVAAYKGDVKALIAHQNKWKTKCIDLTALSFALLGGQKRATRLLTQRRQFRGFFATETVFYVIRNELKTSCFLSCLEPLVRDFLPVLCAGRFQDNAELLCAVLALKASVYRYLRAVCTPYAKQVLELLRGCNNKTRANFILAGMKHVGQSQYDGTAVEPQGEPQKIVVEYLRTNPLKQRQVERATKEAKRGIPEARQIAWREVEAESRFNRFLILESRDVIWSALAASRLTHDSSSNSIRRKQVLNRRLLLDFARSMQKIVQDMLDE